MPVVYLRNYASDTSDLNPRKSCNDASTNTELLKQNEVSSEWQILDSEMLRNQETKILELINENETMLQTLLAFKSENETLKNQLILLESYHDSTVDTNYNDSIKEVDSFEEFEQEAKSTVLFKRASLDEKPNFHPPKMTPSTWIPIERVKKKSNNSNSHEDLAVEKSMSDRNSEHSSSQNLTPRNELYNKLFKINSPRTDEKPTFKTNKTLKKFNNTIVKRTRIKLEKNENKLYNSVLTPKQKDSNILSANKTYKVVRRKKEDSRNKYYKVNGNKKQEKLIKKEKNIYEDEVEEGDMPEIFRKEAPEPNEMSPRYGLEFE